MLRRELRPCVAHRRLKRNHHGLGNALIKRCEIVEYAEQDRSSSLETGDLF